MSQFQFLLTRKPDIRASQVKLLRRIAEKHDCTFTYCDVPGNGTQGWFSGPNLGHPFDRALRQAVEEEVRAVGLLGLFD